MFVKNNYTWSAEYRWGEKSIAYSLMCFSAENPEGLAVGIRYLHTRIIFA